VRVYNTASRQTEDFEPLDEKLVRLYTCGPTVYDYSHIGNLRAYVFDDTLRRVLASAGYSVRHVMNITDVGHLVSDEDEGVDKLEHGAKRENKSVWEVADFYIKAFLDDTRELNILEPNGYNGPHGKYARATDFIAGQIAIVKSLIDKNYAYQTEQAVYFDVSRLDDYGKLTGQRLSDKEVAARSDVVSDPAKKNPQDFALWFFLVGRFANHSLHWSSPWGEGFPGWHLECSAIIHATLGEPIDIHTGGVDHIGTHHTNEIAQTEAAFGKSLAKYWMHNEHLLVDNQKMSKSKHNYYTLSDIKEREFKPLALRLLFLQSHYRSQTNFTWESLEAAQKNLISLQALADLRYQASDAAKPTASDYFDKKQLKILNDVKNDLATPAALARLGEVSDYFVENGLSQTGLTDFEAFLRFVDDVFGLDLLGSEDITAEQKQLISERETARSRSDWTTADSLRETLAQAGLEINDSGFGPIWRRF
jgi:cysteinyl-tRNA synthetase